MRNPAWAIACLLLALTSRPLAADPLAELRGAAFTSVPAGTLQLPHGHVLLHDATIAMLAEDPAGITGIALGEIEVVFNALPSGPGALNLFAELDAARAGSGAAPLEMPATGAYLSAAADSGVQLASAGKAAASRAWSQLTPAEQAGFTEIYLQAYGDSWVRENEPGFALRAPQGKEVYLAFWSRGQASGATQPQAARYDYRVLADGATLTLADYARGITLVQSPWASEAGELDPNLALAEADYAYTLLPAAGAAGRIAVTAWVSFDVQEPAAAVRFLSAPWCGLPEVRPSLRGASAILPQLAVVRGGPGLSDWVLTISGEWAPGEHSLSFAFPETDLPVDFRGPGSAGVYRLDTSPLLPGEQTTDVEVAVATNGGIYQPFGSSPVTLAGTTAHGGKWQLASPGANRNEMVVLTEFPSRAVPTSWGKLNITAPAELLDGTEQLAGVQSLEAMVDYYLRAWGDPRTGAPVPSGVPATPYTLNVFFIPGESGVQAFEDAGMVFILGGQQSYGGQGAGQLPLIAHEVAHVWWGHGVAAPRWFTEGMANYAAARFVEHYYGADGPAAGQGDPLSYRRYLINFGLGSSVPVSLQRRDQLDDSAAIYHESAGFLLTADNRLAGGLDRVLELLYAQHVNGPGLSHSQLRAALAGLAPSVTPLWDSMVEQGAVGTGPDDPTFRELVRTPARENYVAMLGWLNPAYRKSAAGDYAGAYYAMSRALEFRSEPKDLLMAAELALKAGRPEDARRHAAALAGAALDERQRERLAAVQAGLE